MGYSKYISLCGGFLLFCMYYLLPEMLAKFIFWCTISGFSAYITSWLVLYLFPTVQLDRPTLDVCQTIYIFLTGKKELTEQPGLERDSSSPNTNDTKKYVLYNSQENFSGLTVKPEEKINNQKEIAETKKEELDDLVTIKREDTDDSIKAISPSSHTDNGQVSESVNFTRQSVSMRTVTTEISASATQSDTCESQEVQEKDHAKNDQEYNEIKWYEKVKFPNVLLTNDIAVDANNEMLKEKPNLLFNTPVPLCFENALFKGKMMFMLRKQNDDDMEKQFQDAFRGKQRMFWVQIQGKFKQLPKGILFLGGEISKPMKLNIMFRQLSSMILKFIQAVSKGLHFSFGGNGELPHICFPMCLMADRFVQTPPGHTPPILGKVLPESDKLRKFRRSGKMNVRYTTKHIYSFSYTSPYIDFANWEIAKVVGMRGRSLHDFWKEQGLKFVLYEIRNDKENAEYNQILQKKKTHPKYHAQSRKIYYTCFKLSHSKTGHRERRKFEFRESVQRNSINRIIKSVDVRVTKDLHADLLEQSYTTSISKANPLSTNGNQSLLKCSHPDANITVSISDEKSGSVGLYVENSIVTCSNTANLGQQEANLNQQEEKNSPGNLDLQELSKIDQPNNRVRIHSWVEVWCSKQQARKAVFTVCIDDALHKCSRVTFVEWNNFLETFLQADKQTWKYNVKNVRRYHRNGAWEIERQMNRLNYFFERLSMPGNDGQGAHPNHLLLDSFCSQNPESMSCMDLFQSSKQGLHLTCSRIPGSHLQTSGADFQSVPVLRCMWATHWRVQWATARKFMGKNLLIKLYRIDSKIAEIEIDVLKDVSSVASIELATLVFPSAYTMRIEMRGIIVFLGFRTKSERSWWISAILEVLTLSKARLPNPQLIFLSHVTRYKQQARKWGIYAKWQHRLLLNIKDPSCSTSLIDGLTELNKVDVESQEGLCTLSAFYLRKCLDLLAMNVIDENMSSFIAKFMAFENMVSYLQKIELRRLGTQQELQCFFINIYHTILCHSLLVYRINQLHGSTNFKMPSSKTEWSNYNKNVGYVIDKNPYFIGDVRMILLENKVKPECGPPVLIYDNPKVIECAKIAMDLRTHLALNGGTSSDLPCIPVLTSGSSFETELGKITSFYWHVMASFDPSTSSITLPKLMQPLRRKIKTEDMHRIFTAIFRHNNAAKLGSREGYAVNDNHNHRDGTFIRAENFSVKYRPLSWDCYHRFHEMDYEKEDVFDAILLV